MSTTHHTAPSGLPLRSLAAAQIALGDLFMSGGSLKFVNGLELTEDSSLVIRWDGGRTMCEANTTLQVL